MTTTSVGFPLRRSGLTTMQVNLGYRCNQSCSHCHVNAGPTRTEMMGQELLDLIPEVLRVRTPVSISPVELRNCTWFRSSYGIQTLGRSGSGSLQSHHPFGTRAALPRGYSGGATGRGGVSCPVTAPPMWINSGRGVFERSIAGLQQLNALGYELKSDLCLDLVYNPENFCLLRRLWSRTTSGSWRRLRCVLIVC